MYCVIRLKNISHRVIFLEFIVNPRKSVFCFGVREDFSGWTRKPWLSECKAAVL